MKNVCFISQKKLNGLFGQHNRRTWDALGANPEVQAFPRWRQPWPVENQVRASSLPLTVLSAGSEEIYDIFVFPNHLHHLHLWHQIGKVLLRGIIYEHHVHKASVRSPTPPATAASCPALGWNSMKLNVRTRRLFQTISLISLVGCKGPDREVPCPVSSC